MTFLFLNRCLTDKEAHDAQLQGLHSAVDSEIARLTQELQLGQKALDEGAGVFEAIEIKHQRDVNKTICNIPLQVLKLKSWSCFQLKEFYEKHKKVLESIQYLVNNSNFPTDF